MERRCLYGVKKEERETIIVFNEADNEASMDELEDFACIDGFSEFFRVGFTGREPEWVEAIRYGDIPECGYSINYADNKREPGVSCIRIIRKQGDEDYNSVYDVTLGIGDDRDKIRIHGWYLGGVGSDGYTICGILNSSTMNRLGLEALKLCKNNAGFEHKRDMPNMPNRMPISH